MEADGLGASRPEEALGLACPGEEGRGREGTCTGDNSGKKRALSSAGRPERGGRSFRSVDADPLALWLTLT